MPARRKKAAAIAKKPRLVAQVQSEDNMPAASGAAGAGAVPEDTFTPGAIKPHPSLSEPAVSTPSPQDVVTSESATPIPEGLVLPPVGDSGAAESTVPVTSEVLPPVEPPPTVVDPAAASAEVPVPTSENAGENVPAEPEKKSGRGLGSAASVILGFVVGVAAGAGGVYLWGTYYQSAATNKAPAVTADTTGETAEPTARPTTAPVTVDRAEISVQILNGSGVRGAAGSARDYLMSLGYKDVDTGNADESNFTETQVSVKTGQEETLDLVKKDLEGKYTVGPAQANLPESSEYDAVVVLGRN